MQTTSDFKNSIANVFYDKDITLYKTETVVDIEGRVSKSEPTSEVKTFKGNVRFDKLDEVKQSYGLTVDIDIVISTHEDVAVDSLVSYKGVYYLVVQSIPFDTHNLLLGRKWSLKYSTWISA